MKFFNCWASGMIVAALIGVMAATPVFVSPLLGQQAPTTQPARGRGRGPSLGGAMRSMDQAFNGIQAQYSDPTKNNSTLMLLTTFETQAIAAKSVLPPAINRMPEADRKKATDEYRLMLRNLVRASLDLEDQITAGDTTKAAATIATMREIEKSGHAEFRPNEN
jgi:hypothetical protein